MKVVKPKRLAFLSKVVEHDRRPYLTVTLLVCFPFGVSQALLYEASLWAIAAQELGPDGVLDELYAKPRGEVLVNGRCFAPAGAPCLASSVRLQVGSVNKTLDVFGDRIWNGRGISTPEPFVEMPITYRNAFGGEGFAANPLGKGAQEVRVSGRMVRPLPNLEDPKHRVRHPHDRPEPAGLDGYPITWPQRIRKLGTHDDAWRENEFPGFAPDLDPTFFNSAPPDQQIERYFRGDEAFLFDNMHPELPRIEGALPGVSTRCFINQGSRDGTRFREAETRLETLRFFPHRQRGVLVFRGVIDVREDDANDVLQVVVACERMGHPKPVEHYRAVLGQRLDRSAVRDVACEDDDLMPWPEEVGAKPLPDDTLSGVALLLKREDFSSRRGGSDTPAAPPTDALREAVAAAGMANDPVLAAMMKAAAPPAPHVAPPPVVPQILDDDPPEVKLALEGFEKTLRAQGLDPKEVLHGPDAAAPGHDAKQEAAAEAELRAVAKKQGIDLDALMGVGKAHATPAPPTDPKQVEDPLRALRAAAKKAGASSPEFEAMLSEPDPEPARAPSNDEAPAGNSTHEAYRLFAHTMPASSRLDGDVAARLRADVVVGHPAGRSFAGCDLTGADLSGLDLQGINLEGAMLESVVLAGADLRNANLGGAVLAHGDLEGADLRGAKVQGINAGSANLRDVNASGGIDLTDAVLVEADLSGANLTGANISSADLSGAKFSEADLSGVTAKRALFTKVDLSRASLKAASLQRCTFIEARVSGVDFSGANLSSTTFIRSQGDRAVFRLATLANFTVIQGSTFENSDFRGAMLEGANLTGTDLSGSDFSDANLRGALLNDCNLSGATLNRVVLVDAMLIRADLTGASLFAADLMQCLLPKANLSGADLEKANLFGADASRTVVDDGTSFAGANLKRAQVQPISPWDRDPSTPTERGEA